MSFIDDIYEFRKSFRHIEKLTLRCVHLKNAIEFNDTCLNNGIFPNYCHIYNYNINIIIIIQGVPQKCTLFLYYLYLQLKLRYFKSIYFML